MAGPGNIRFRSGADNRGAANNAENNQLNPWL